MNLNVRKPTIFDLLATKTKYIVPRYQRPYCWEKEQVVQLWDDIIDNISLDEKGEYKIESYFIGSLVLIGPPNATEFFIVDGQQRLTTVVIFLSALVEAFKSLGEEDKARGVDSLITGQDINNRPFFKLISETPAPFFQQSIQAYDKNNAAPSSEEEQYLFDTYTIATKLIQTVEKDFTGKAEAHIKYLEALRNAITGLKVVVVDVDNEDDAYSIFETLNSTGKNLTVVDLIKNYCFRILCDTHPVDEAKIKWTAINTTLKQRDSKQDFVKFFLHYWKSAYEFISKNRIYKSFKKHVTEDKDVVRNFLNTLDAECKNYNLITKPLITDWPQQESKAIYKSLKAISSFHQVVQVRIILLALVWAWQEKKVNHSDFKEALLALENFTFLYSSVCNLSPAGLESKYSNYARRLRKTTTTVEAKDVLKELKQDLKQKAPSKDVFKEKFHEIWFTTDIDDQKPLVQYILKKIELYLQPTDEIDFDSFTIEHIASQSDKTVAACCGHLGNLLPLSGAINGNADTKPFPEKLKLYETSNLESVKSFVKHYSKTTTWTDAEILIRTDNLASLAYDSIWTI